MRKEYFLFKVLGLLADSLWSPVDGGITAPVGFKAAGIQAGLKPSGKPDLALLLAPEGAVCAATFTQNLVRAACVDLSAARLANTFGKARAVLINSGQANACTGNRGINDSLLATQELADRLGVKAEEVLMCSTGVIGERIPISQLITSLEPLVENLSDFGGPAAAQAILTTDLVDKQIAFEAEFGGRKVRIGGMAKGSGMIHPNMATMLAYLTCDVGVRVDLWQEMITRVVQGSFNAITVDGDTSTNDAFLAFNAGEPFAEDNIEILEAGLNRVSQHLAKDIVRDGEGASCLFQIKVEGAETNTQARQVARIIASSSLVKTAIHGADPNWGRIIAAAGRAGVSFSSKDVSLWLGSYQLMQSGVPTSFNRDSASNYIQRCIDSSLDNDETISIRLSIGSGDGIGIAWGCDLSDQYVRINADYTT